MDGILLKIYIVIFFKLNVFLWVYMLGFVFSPLYVNSLFLFKGFHNDSFIRYI